MVTTELTSNHTKQLSTKTQETSNVPSQVGTDFMNKQNTFDTTKENRNSEIIKILPRAWSFPELTSHIGNNLRRPLVKFFIILNLCL